MSGKEHQGGEASANLEWVLGIGPVYNQKLGEHGIRTDHDLATTTVAKLQAVGFEHESEEELQNWINQAKHKLGMTELVEIHGIGPAYASKLAAHGIHTHQHLSEASVEHVRGIGFEHESDHELRRWINHSRHKTGKGRADLEWVNGVGPVYNERLSAQGIHTSEDLAHVSVQRLRAVGFEHESDEELNSWIHQANERLKAGGK